MNHDLVADPAGVVVSRLINTITSVYRQYAETVYRCFLVEQVTDLARRRISTAEQQEGSDKVIDAVIQDLLKECFPPEELVATAFPVKDQ